MHLFNPGNPNCGSVLWDARSNTRLPQMDQVTLPAMVRVLVPAGHSMLTLFPDAAGWHYLRRVYVNGLERARVGDLFNSWDYVDVSRSATRVHTLYWWDSFASLDRYQQDGLLQSLRFRTTIGSTVFDSAGPTLRRSDLLADVESVAGPVTMRGEFTQEFRFWYDDHNGEQQEWPIQLGVIWFEIGQRDLVIGQKLVPEGSLVPPGTISEVAATQGWAGHFTMSWLAPFGGGNVRSRPELRFAEWAAFSLLNPPHVDIMYPFPVTGQVLVGQDGDTIRGADLGQLEVQPYWV